MLHNWRVFPGNELEMNLLISTVGPLGQLNRIFFFGSNSIFELLEFVIVKSDTIFFFWWHIIISPSRSGDSLKLHNFIILAY